MKHILIVLVLLQGFNLKAQISDFSDSSYAENGLVTIDLDTSVWLKNTIMRTDVFNNQYVFLGLDSNIIVKKFREDGSLNLDFGVEGEVSIKFNSSNRLKEVLIADDGFYVVFFEADFVYLCAYTLDGQVDKTFGEEGKLVINDSITPNYKLGIIDNQIVVCVLHPISSGIALNLPMMTLDKSGEEISMDTLFFDFQDFTQFIIRDIFFSAEDIFVGSSIYYSDMTLNSFSVTKCTSKGLLDENFGIDGQFNFAQDSVIGAAFTKNDESISFSLITRSLSTYGLIDLEGNLQLSYGIPFHENSLRPDINIIQTGYITTLTDGHYLHEFHLYEDWTQDIFLSKYALNFELDTTYGTDGRYLLPNRTRQKATDKDGRMYFETKTDSTLSIFRTKKVIETATNQELDFGSDLQVYPNPTAGIIHFSSSQNNPINRVCRIYDASGKMHGERYVNNSQMNVEGLNNGIYFIKFEGLYEDRAYRFIKID